jgi:membrane protein required for colicin V production
MHTLDILFIIAGAFFIFVGVRRGLIGELFRLIALIVGFFVAFLYYPDLVKFCRFNPPYLANAVTFTLIFLAVFLAIIGTGWLLKKIVHLTPLGWIDSFFGGAIGLAKAAFIFWVICLSCASFPLGKFTREVHHSIVFQMYDKLPPGMKFSGVANLRALFKKNISQDMPQKQKKPQLPKKKVDTSKTTTADFKRR